MIARQLDAWTDPDFAAIADRLGDVAGLTFPRNRIASAEGGLRRVMSRARIGNPRALREALDAGRLVDDVVAELTIGETYFFRDERQFELVRDAVIPDLLSRATPGGALRFWSAACSSGEEPYSLAILLREMRMTHPARILGTDLSAARLASARRARYGRWSFRGVPEAIVERYFTHERRQYTLDPAVARDVEFRVLNLAGDDYPSTATGVFGMDLIMCRNALIYFEPDVVAHVAARLLDSLSEEGWLLLGASDPALSGLVPCDVIVTDAGLAYRRPRARPSTIAPVALPPVDIVAPNDAIEVAAIPELPLATIAPSVAPVPTPIVGSSETPTLARRARSAYAAGDYDAAAEDAARALSVMSLDEPEDVALWALRVRALANRGRLDAAGAACAAALDRHPLDAELVYLQAVLLAANGRSTDAIAAARRAIYLDRHLAVAHLLLGEHLARTGDRDGARKALGNAERLLDAMPADAPVPAADGEPAARLLRAVRAQRTAIARGAA